MTVRELITELQKLDQDRGIWVYYDYPCDAFEPLVDAQATKEDERIFKSEGVKKGDYIIYAG
jgi:hypothetical protein